MATSKRSRVVQTVFRPDGATVTSSVKETVSKPAPKKVVDLPVHNATAAERKKAAVGVKKRTPPKQKVQQKRVSKPKAVKHVRPHVLKSTEGLPLAERLNDVLLGQLKTRVVTNKAAAEALGVHPNYLSQVVAGMQDKLPGQVRAFRLGRSKLAKARNHTRQELAKQVHRGEITITKACKQANCTERTMYRWMAKYANQKQSKKAA